MYTYKLLPLVLGTLVSGIDHHYKKVVTVTTKSIEYCGRVFKIHGSVCHAAQETVVQHHEYIDRKTRT